MNVGITQFNFMLFIQATNFLIIGRIKGS